MPDMKRKHKVNMMPEMEEVKSGIMASMPLLW
jgi:hypothetical protein